MLPLCKATAQIDPIIFSLRALKTGGRTQLEPKSASMQARHLTAVSAPTLPARLRMNTDSVVGSFVKRCCPRRFFLRLRKH
jgi:hypothetical protein